MHYHVKQESWIHSTTKEMRLSLIILVLCYYQSNSKSEPVPQEKSEWKQSRFIIDNRKNILFSRKSFYPLYQESSRKEISSLTNGTSNEKFSNYNSNQKDFSIDSSIVEPNYHPKNSDKSFPRILEKSEGDPKEVKANDLNYTIKKLEYPKNTTNLPSDKNFLPKDGILNNREHQQAYNPNSKAAWVPNSNTNTVTDSTSQTINSHFRTRFMFTENKNFQESQIKNRQPQIYGIGRPTKNPFTWEQDERKNDRNQIKKNTELNEKHVYETRIETVSYHKEIIFPLKTSTNPENFQWYLERKEQESEEILKNQKVHEESYMNVREIFLEKPIKNYANSEVNNEKPIKNYEEPERNYEEPERNYEEPEGNYEEPERNYEEPERNYEEPERNYEEPERNYGIEGMDKNYNEPKRNREVGTVHVMSEGIMESEEKSKFGYVEEGNNFRRYRVEERTPDGFIVGEYGVVSHDDGSLRGVRYTAEGTINPQLIYDSLIKFLSL